jgi:hypothetical protein
MSWEAPKTWVPDELVTAALLNTHLRDNLNALKTPPSDHYECDESSNYSTTSESFVDVDSTNLALSLTTNGGDVLVHFHGVVTASNGIVYFDVEIDDGGTPYRVGGDDGIIATVVQNLTPGHTITFTRLITGLDAGAYVFSLQWKKGSGGATLWAGAGTSTCDLHPQFWVREVS